MNARHLRLLVLSILFVAALAATTVASAVSPTAWSPTTVKNYNFETAGATLEDIHGVEVSADATLSAWWGRMSGRGVGSSYGLWCAGTKGPLIGEYLPERANSSAPWISYYVNHPFGNYPVGTYGVGLVAVPADYYTSTLSFQYLMPSYGAEDWKSFIVRWFADSNPSSLELHYGYPTTTSTGWSTVSYGMTYSARSVKLSRTAGTVQFVYRDFIEGDSTKPRTGVATRSENPSTGQVSYTIPADHAGQGATLDNVKLTGFKYGPVRSLTASLPSPTVKSVRLEWAKPYRAVGSTTVEERPVTYRIWRARDMSFDTWTELTAGSRVATETYTDSTNLADGTRYKYVVQAWDEGAGNGNGVLAPATAELRMPGNKPSVSISKPVACKTTSPYAAVSGALVKYRTYRWKGRLTPKHAAGANSAYISISKYNPSKKAFIYLRKYQAKNTTRSTYTEYGVNFPLGPGRYKLTPVVPEDTLHARTVGSPNYYTVK